MQLPQDPIMPASGDSGLVSLDVSHLGESEIEQVRTQLLEAAAGLQGQDLHVDLGRLEYLSSSGLGLFLGLHREVRAAGGRLSLHNVRGVVYEVFAVTRLTTVLDVRPLATEQGPAA